MQNCIDQVLKVQLKHRTIQKSNEMSEIVVVTGASGCLGHATVRLLISRDSERVGEIRCLDWRAPSELQLKAIDEDLSGQQQQQDEKIKVRQFRGDIRDINLIEQVLAGAHCVIHCAARVDIWTESSEQQADELESVNVEGTENLLRACVRLGVAKFVHVSSYEVFVSYHTIYYATEATIPDPNHLLFGPSASSKKQAEVKVRQYASQKLQKKLQEGQSDALNAVIIRFTPIYGEFDRHYVSEILKLIKFFNGKLQRFTNIWIRQQPIYVGNAAWALIAAKRRMDLDESISGEEFHITDDTPIGDPFDFIEPFAESRNMKVTTSTFPAWPVWLLIVLFTFMRNSLASLDVFGLFTKRKTRLDQAIERDNNNANKQANTRGLSATDELAQFADFIEDQQECGSTGHNEHLVSSKKGKKRWYHLVTAQIFYFMCNSLFLNRTKASLRLNYEPIFDHKESMERSLNWYKNHLRL